MAYWNFNHGHNFSIEVLDDSGDPLPVEDDVSCDLDDAGFVDNAFHGKLTEPRDLRRLAEFIRIAETPDVTFVFDID